MSWRGWWPKWLIPSHMAQAQPSSLHCFFFFFILFILSLSPSPHYQPLVFQLKDNALLVELTLWRIMGNPHCPRSHDEQYRWGNNFTGETITFHGPQPPSSRRRMWMLKSKTHWLQVESQSIKLNRSWVQWHTSIIPAQEDETKESWIGRPTWATVRFFLKKQTFGAGEMVPWVRVLAAQAGEPELESQHSYKKPGMVACSCILSAMGGADRVV